MARDLTVPASIIIGGALIGGGLYFGLRSQEPPAAPAVAPTQAASAPGATTAPEPTQAPVPAQTNPTPSGALTPEARKRVELDAQKAIASLKTEWKKKCWDPAIKTTAAPETSKYSVNLSFSDEGKVVGVGWSERRDVPSRPDVAQCLRQTPITFTVTAPGAGVSIDLPVEFP